MEVVYARAREERLDLVVLWHIPDGAADFFPHTDNRFVPSAVADSGKHNGEMILLCRA